MEMIHNLRAPLDVQWELTPWCCYNCQHCYNYWRREISPKRILTPQELQIHSKTAEELLVAGVFHATLTGGEPLGVLEQVFPLLQNLHSHKVYLTMNTNLALFDRDKAHLLRQLGIHSLLTSVISGDEHLNDELAQNHGAYKHTIRGIELALAEGFRVSVNMVVSAKNVHTVYQTGKLAHDLGVTTFAGTKVSKPSNCSKFGDFLLSIEQTQQILENLLRIRSDFGLRVDSLEPYPASIFTSLEMQQTFGRRQCSAGQTSCAIGVNGEVRPCAHGSNSYGNTTMGLAKAWESMREWSSGELIPRECFNCPSYPKLCNGGCRIESLNAENGISGMDPYCTGVATIPEKGKKKSLLSIVEDTRVVLHEKVRFREETFGYVAYRNSIHWEALDFTLGQLLQSAQERGGINAHDIACAYKVDVDQALDTMRVLLYKGLVVEIQS
jgi:radical SAM protein with 4Fe4S-binding SPASM domain